MKMNLLDELRLDDLKHRMQKLRKKDKSPLTVMAMVIGAVVMAAVAVYFAIKFIDWLRNRNNYWYTDDECWCDDDDCETCSPDGESCGCGCSDSEDTTEA